jgi:hypothetical protein
LSTTGKLCEKLILRIQITHWGKNLLNASQLDFRADRSTTLQCVSLVGSHHPKFQQLHVDGCCVLGYRESLWHNMALSSTI